MAGQLQGSKQQGFSGPFPTLFPLDHSVLEVYSPLTSCSVGHVQSTELPQVRQQKHLKDDQWNQEEPELSSQLRGEGGEFLWGFFNCKNLNKSIKCKTFIGRYL